MRLDKLDVMSKIRIYKKPDTSIGVLSFDKKKNKFTFKYDDDFKGFPFGDIDSTISRTHTSKTLFSMFAFEDCWNRQQIVEKYNLKDPNGNSDQWFILNIWAKQGSSLKGIYFETLLDADTVWEC
ncbi:MAG: hypothetical protein GQ570_05325 [Helicobacteraceae bacterium]|nr:hypothetical protein [Helicobacteraceae bacterium]